MVWACDSDVMCGNYATSWPQECQTKLNASGVVFLFELLRECSVCQVTFRDSDNSASILPVPHRTSPPCQYVTPTLS